MVHNNYRMMDGHNKADYRCDKLTKEHDGKHVLFIGDSFAAGDGLDIEDTWCYKVYKKISEKEKTSGYFNIGTSGGAISEAVDQLFKYCYHYGNPDVVFFVTTEFNREDRYVKDSMREAFVIRMYIYLEQYCRSNGIKLFSFSWIKSIDAELGSPERYTWTDGHGNEIVRPLWTEQSRDNTKDLDYTILNQFETFYDYNGEDMVRKVFEFDIKTKTPHKSLWAEDGCHPGTSFHDFYADMMYSRYRESK